MMENPRLEEENIIKVVKNLFRLEKQKNETIHTKMKDIRKYFQTRKKKKKLKILRDIRNVFRLEKENKVIKDIILRNINSFENEEENDHKPVGVSNFQSSNCIECESNGDRNKTLSVDESFNKVIPYLTKHYK